jgi:hypothetical protein
LARDSCEFHKATRKTQRCCASGKQKAAISEKIRSAAYEMHDLQSVTIMQLSIGPLRTRHDFAIQFDGHAITLHPESPDEFGQRAWFCTNFRFAIHE